MTFYPDDQLSFVDYLFSMTLKKMETTTDGNIH